MAFKFINLWQTADERRQKYFLARSLGVNAQWATMMRDWRLSKIERRFGLDGLCRSFNLDPSGPYAQFLLPGFTINPAEFKTTNSDALRSISSAP